MECSGSAPYLSDHGGAGVAHRVARIGHHATADRSGRVAARRDGPGSAYRTARFVRVAHHAAGVRVPRSAVEQHVSGRGRCPQVRDRGRGDGGGDDTGVDASPRVPAEPGGDFVDQAGNGLSDCDAHGTLTASIIAGRPAPTDGFVGVAPDARLLSLRQTSEAFEPVGSQANPNDPNATPAAGSIRSLARAVVHAANLGVGVINISEAACYKVSRPIDETSLGASIDYAVNVKGVVVVVAAGNTGGDCVQNPAPDPSTPGDPRGWNNVQTVVTPAWYAPLVLSVGGIGQTGMPSSFSMHGPWVDVAAPAENIVALGDTGEPVNALQGREGPVPIAGTSFAAAYVSGLAALLRQRFPDLTPAQIIHRITATARHPGGGVDDLVGAGVIDAVAALTWDIPPGPASAPYNVRRLPPPVVEPGPDRRPITAVALVAVGLTLALGLGALARRALSRR